MAGFEIQQPQVGKTLLNTFSTMNEANRRRQQLELMEQKQAQASLMQDVRNRALDLRETSINNKWMIDNARLAQTGEVNEVRMSEAASRLALRQLEIDRAKVEGQALSELSLALTAPTDESGTTLSKRLNSPDPAVQKEAFREFSILADNYRGKGKQALNFIKSIEDNFTDEQRAELNAQREERLARTSAATAAARTQRVDQSGRQLKYKDLTANIGSAEKAYKDLKDRASKTKDANERARLDAEAGEVGKIADELKAQRSKLADDAMGASEPSTLSGAAQGDIDPLRGPQDELPPVSPNAAEPSVLPPLGSTPPAQVAAEWVPVLDPQGRPGRVKASQLEAALQNGYKRRN